MTLLTLSVEAQRWAAIARGARVAATTAVVPVLVDIDAAVVAAVAGPDNGIALFVYGAALLAVSAAVTLGAVFPTLAGGHPLQALVVVEALLALVLARIAIGRLLRTHLGAVQREIWRQYGEIGR